MIKKIILFVVLASVLSACGGGDDAERALNENTRQYIDLISEVLDDSNALLSDFSETVDELYVGNKNEEQFHRAVADLVPRSREISGNLDSGIHLVIAELQPFHREMIELINNQHQLLLSTLESVDNENLRRGELGRNISEIRQNQSQVIENLNRILRQ
ncbi:hypothetical protein J2S74_002906 [Evansella vedderi]|uniref:Lipoprotein n=1 Tax=Evansella vedderi TaxID=38282 RepID=A0ABT9ZWB7_9BACI|nr:hypothetical protein [Evansella vedderi]MDQ0255524.1 hypothetical protein [Evansella vedderi]